jgi:heme A synthase
MDLPLSVERYEAMFPEVVHRVPAGTVGLFFILLVTSALEAIALRRTSSLYAE